MPTWLGWALAAAVLVAVVIVLWLKLRGRGPDILKAFSGMAAKWYERELMKKQAELDELKNQSTATADEAKRAEARLAKAEAKLAQNYERQGLSAEEIAKRFNELRNRNG